MPNQKNKKITEMNWQISESEIVNAVGLHISFGFNL